MGGPGSGKGTQSAKIVEKYHFSHLSTGELLRAEVAKGTPKGNELNEMMARGELVPTEEVLRLLKEAMENDRDTANGFIIDG